MIKLGLIDDHKLFRKGVKAILEMYDDFEVVLEADHGRSLLTQLRTTDVDILLLDLEMPEMDGLETMKQLREDHDDISAIIVSMHNDEKFIVHLMEIGANGYLLKNAEPEEIEDAIRSVDNTGYYFSDHVSKVMLNGLVKKQKIKPSFSQDIELTDREKEVLKMICHEKTTSEIADELYLSPRTVEGHRNNIISKTGARNTAGIVLYAIKNKVVDLD